MYALPILAPLAMLLSTVRADTHESSLCGEITSDDVYGWPSVTDAQELSVLEAEWGGLSGYCSGWVSKGDLVVQKESHGGVCWYTLGKYSVDDNGGEGHWTDCK